ncbi:protein phosphatase 1 regulatory subunit 7 [Canna indica]|uniref:Protein phosphatase 1 regulatory subunit 7 n=1 Tax=Canna indica TaxID=4628 RepID=A0AAQ3L152_9LILI|nr:protein phosphatase 1 regulatory subunit 7 [Canna indica]
MGRLTLEQISQESKGGADATTSLNLSHRILSDVSCLSNFHNLERLDLSFNCLSSLEDLSSCVNLKWLSVMENKLETLKGVEGLSKLTILNAGKNMLCAMDEIKSLTSLRALILNDNKIPSICKLDHLSFLNTLVLSRNPIHNIGDSLVKAKSITKLSLSHCHIQYIGSSLTSCVDLKEARFAHNMIMSLPAELARNTKLQNLDMGNNLIENSSDIKVLSVLYKLKNLNLQGNPIAEKDKLAKKVKKLVPHLQIFNAKPLQRSNKVETTAREEKSSYSKDDDFSPYASKNEAATELKRKKKKTNVTSSKNILQNSGLGYDALPASTNVEVKKESARKSTKLNSKSKRNVVTDDNPPRDSKESHAKKGSKRKNYSDREQSKFEGIDDAETPFMDLIFLDNATRKVERSKKGQEVVADGELLGALVVDHAKKRKKSKNILGALALQLLPPTEVGIGGPSAWDDNL